MKSLSIPAYCMPEGAKYRHLSDVSDTLGYPTGIQQGTGLPQIQHHICSSTWVSQVLQSLLDLIKFRELRNALSDLPHVTMISTT